MLGYEPVRNAWRAGRFNDQSTRSHVRLHRVFLPVSDVSVQLFDIANYQSAISIFPDLSK
jgi:hypothetical protein